MYVINRLLGHENVSTGLIRQVLSDVLKCFTLASCIGHSYYQVQRV